VVRLVPTILVLLVCAYAIAVYDARSETASDGTLVHLSDRMLDSNLTIHSIFSSHSALKPGDVVTHIDGVPVDEARPVSSSISHTSVYRVLRNGTNISVRVSYQKWDWTPWLKANWPSALLAGVLLSLAISVFRRRPRDPAAIALLATSICASIGAPSYALGSQVIELATQRNQLLYGIGDAFLAAAWAFWFFFVLVFPAPALNRSVRYLALVSLCAFIVMVAAYAVVSAATASSVTVWHWRMLGLSYPATYFYFPLIIMVVFARYRRPRSLEEKRYLSWLGVTFGSCIMLYFALWQLPVTLFKGSLAPWTYAPLIFVACPIALSWTVLRFGLFDMQQVARESLLYGLLTACVLSGYIVIVALSGFMISDYPVFASPIIAMCIMALLFQPLRQRVQRGANRLIYGTRDEPYTALSRLGERLETTGPLSDIPTSIIDAVQSSLRVPFVSLNICASDGTTLAEVVNGQTVGYSVTAIHEFPAITGGQCVGWLRVLPRSMGSGFTGSEMRLLSDLARQAAPAIQAMRLNVELDQSRQHLVRARDEERQRLQRDLHDGVGPALAGVTMQLGAVRVSLEQAGLHEPGVALRSLESQLQDCARDVRRCLVGMRAPLLDTLGLAGALAYQGVTFSKSATLSVHVECDELSALPGPIEEAAYAIASEALTNVSRHAGASYCSVSIRRRLGELVLKVVDNGQGLAPDSTRGIGLPSMRQRTVNLGGVFQILAVEPQGTEVLASFPLES
jgi:two-component system, NarL family, sensor kinase